ncbi:class I adenylate cyclase [Aestuariirhabdus sp. Z084]|uniref:class I adenylate cyclase n=1 Tax=Aestuariirhabdus haliotis TaxID=2918751 RepID=UPI00201B4584|nr:class I adenylate cyclase [Aestuariirhabdus haliotis]MCL6416127.1 class I adenylate cyclase [Aestuariirhabdus haliotis]MCL6420116.1 class I adenylate cyclase [Aestuariirhabdus haliotis]
MSQTKSLIDSLEGGVDRKTLKRIQQRFMEINQGRLLRARDGLSQRQQLFLDLLPLLFMENHPLLPGFVTYKTPAGISRYEPDKRVLREANRLSRSFRYSRKPHRQRSIYSLFLMGSCGSLAHSNRSDLDVWVCHAPDLKTAQQDELQRKCTLIELWAVSFNLEVHFFLMDDEKFRHRQHHKELSGEDCGSAQHSLLLDEFYRTALLLAGRYPIWWLIPPDDEHRYQHHTQRLREQRYIQPDETVDFGGITEIPPGEFVGAGMWQMFKGLASPYKSVLKLMLTELYASRTDELISITFKRRIYAGETSLDALDPYILLYQKLERYLLGTEHLDRLELVRKALYFKVGKRLSQTPRRSRSWQRNVLEQLIQTWQWQPQQLRDLDQHNQWKVDRVLQERAALVSQLMHSYRFLNQYGHNHQEGLISQRDMQLLGRRLYAAFERRANKLPVINPGISEDMSESNLSIVCHGQKPAEWRLYRGALKHQDLDRQPILKRTHSIVQLLAWCHLNRILDSSSSVSLFPGNSALTEYELQQIINALRQTLPVETTSIDDDTYLEPSRPSTVLLVINAGIDPMKASSERNVHLLSNRTDSLGFSAMRANQVITIDQLCINSWNEWSLSRFEGPDALVHCLQEYLNQTNPQSPPELNIRCYCRNRAQPIQDRVTTLFADTQRHLLSPDTHSRGRYLLQVEHQFHLFQMHQQVTVRSLEDEAALVLLLGQPQTEFSPLLVDRYALQDSPLSLVLPRNEAGKIQLFYQQLRAQDRIRFYLLDERGSLLCQTSVHGDLQRVLEQLYRFLQRLLFRLNAHLEQQANDLPTMSIELYELVASSDFGPKQLRAVSPPPANPHPYLEIQVIIGLDSEGEEQATLFCGEREFNPLDYEGKQLQAAADFIRTQHRGRELSRCYITDLAMPLSLNGERLQSIHYLQRKRDIETQLNAYLQADADRLPGQ